VTVVFIAGRLCD